MTVREPAWDELRSCAESALGERLDAVVEPICADAGVRRYARAWTGAGDSVILAYTAGLPRGKMDRFWHVARELDRAGVRVPRRLAAVPELDLVVMTDLGESTLETRLSAIPTRLELVSDTVRTLARVHRANAAAVGDRYDVGEQLRDLKSTFAPAARALGWAPIPEFDEQLRRVERKLAASEPRCVVHGDFHARNIVLDCDGRVGVIDFQDAAVGPAWVDWAAVVYDHNRDATRTDLAAWEDSAIAILDDPPEVRSNLRWAGVFWHARLAGVCTRLRIDHGPGQFTRELRSVSKWIALLAELDDLVDVRDLCECLSTGTHLVATRFQP